METSLTKMLKVFSFQLVAAGTCVSFSVHAQDSQTDFPKWLDDALAPIHYSLNQTVENTSRGLDAYFGTQDGLTVDNRSYLRFAQDVVYVEGRGTFYDTRLRYRLDLPTTREKLRLVIENDGDRLEDGSENGATNQVNANNNSLNTGDSSVGLERVNDEDSTKRWRTSTGVGLRVNSGFDPYVRTTAQRVWLHENSPWSQQLFSRVSYFKKRDLIFQTNFHINRAINETSGWRLRNELFWEKRRNSDAFLYNAIEYNRLIDNRNAIRLSAIALGDTARDTNFYDRVLQVYYRRDIHRRYIYLDVIPEMHFPRINNIDPYYALTLRLEFYFQANYFDSIKTKGSSTNFTPIR